MKIVDQQGRPPEERVREILRKVKEKLDTQSGPVIRDGLRTTVRRHFQSIYPNSKHYDPERVIDDYARGNVGAVEIHVPGITRAYHDMHIRPVDAKKLTIPLHRSAYGKKASEFGDLFYAKTKKGTELLGRRTYGTGKGGVKSGVVWMYVLKDYVFQKRDRRLMPSDQTLADNILSRIRAWLSRTAVTV